MTSCEHVRSQLLEHLYDLLEEEQVRALDDHLRDCGNCQTELGHAREQIALMAAAAKEEFPKVHFVPPTEKTLEVSKISEILVAPKRWGIRWAVAAAILCAVAGVAAPATIYWRQESQVAQSENTLRRAKDELAGAEAQRLRILDETQQVNADFRRQLGRIARVLGHPVHRSTRRASACGFGFHRRDPGRLVLIVPYRQAPTLPGVEAGLPGRRSGESGLDRNWGRS